MTDNISRMYELSGIPVSEWYLCYPPFTAEKQLNLIKWLILNPFIDEISLCYNEPSKTYNIEIYNIPECGNFRDSRIEFNCEFEQTLASLVCELWEDLTPEQRKEVRGILQ